MKNYIFLFFLLVNSINADVIDINEVDRKVKETLLPPNRHKSDISWITDKNRQTVYDNLLQKFSMPEVHHEDSVQEALVRVGHPETIKLLISTAAIDRNNNTLLDQATMDAILYLMDAINDEAIETKDPPPSGDVGYCAVRDVFASAVCRAILREASVSPATHDWAKRLDSAIGVPPQAEQRMNLLKQWWTHNQQAIIEKRYADATWLPLYKGKPSVLDWNEQEERTAEQIKLRSSRETERVASAGEIMRKFPSNTWEVFASLTALVLLLLGFLRWKSSREHLP